MSLADPNISPLASYNTTNGKQKQGGLTHKLSVSNGFTTEHSKTILRIISSLGEGAVGVPALKSVAQLGLELVAVIENMKANKATCRRLAYKVARIVESARSAVVDVSNGTPPRHEALTKRINEVASQLATVLSIIEKIHKRNAMARMIYNAEDVTSLAECDHIADDCLRLLSIEFQATDHATLDRIENLLTEMNQYRQRAILPLEPQPTISVQYPTPSVSVSMPEPFSPFSFPPQEPQATYLQVPNAQDSQPTQPLRRAASSPSLPQKGRTSSADDTTPVQAKIPKEKSKGSGTPSRTSSGTRKTGAVSDGKPTRRTPAVPDTESEDDQPQKRSSSSAPKRSKSSSKSKTPSRTPSPKPPSTRKSQAASSEPRSRSAPPPHAACNGCPTCAPHYPPYAHHAPFYPPHPIHYPPMYNQSPYTPFPPHQYAPHYPPSEPSRVPSPFAGASNGANLASSIQGFVQASISSALGATAQRLAGPSHRFHPATPLASSSRSKSKTRNGATSSSKSRRLSTDDEDDIFDIFTTDSDESASDSDD